MTVIKNLAFTDKNKLKNLNSFVESELDMKAFYPFPIDFLHHFLPFGLKFLSESFVSVENKKINGLVSVNKTGKKRVKITRLLLDEISSEAGKILINCVVGMYLSKGAKSFYAVVDKLNTPLLMMFQDGCGFKNYAKEVVYKMKNEELRIDDFGGVNFEHILKMSNKHVGEVKALLNGLMLAYQKPVFGKDSSEIRRGFIYSPEQFVVVDKEKNKILGYFTILKLNNSDYLLDFVISSGYEGYASDIVKFAKAKLFINSEFKTLFVRLKSYYINFNELNNVFDIDYKNSKENVILVKNFMVPKREGFKYERMIFNDVTPAF